MILIVTAAVIAVGMTCWHLFRRRIGELDPSSLLDPQHCKIVKRVADNDIQVVVDAFSTSLDMVWTLQNDTSVPVKEPQKFQVLLTYMMTFIIRLTETYGHVIEYRSDTDGEFLGYICMVPVLSSSLLTSWLLKTAITSGKPPLQDDPGTAERFNAFGQTTDYHHEIMGSKSRHWWVANLAVSPTAQSKGVGRKLLDQAKAIAKEGNQQLYLECTDKNTAYYAKNGFELRKRFFLDPKSEVSSVYPMNAMVF